MCHLCHVLMRIDVKAASINLLERMDFGEPSQQCCLHVASHPRQLPQAAHLSIAAAVAATTVCLSVCLYSCLSALASTVLAHTHTHSAIRRQLPWLLLLHPKKISFCCPAMWMYFKRFRCTLRWRRRHCWQTYTHTHTKTHTHTPSHSIFLSLSLSSSHPCQSQLFALQ